jgi:hypothetical protein
MYLLYLNICDRIFYVFFYNLKRANYDCSLKTEKIDFLSNKILGFKEL